TYDTTPRGSHHPAKSNTTLDHQGVAPTQAPPHNPTGPAQRGPPTHRGHTNQGRGTGHGHPMDRKNSHQRTQLLAHTPTPTLPPMRAPSPTHPQRGSRTHRAPINGRCTRDTQPISQPPHMLQPSRRTTRHTTTTNTTSNTTRPTRPTHPPMDINKHPTRTVL